MIRFFCYALALSLLALGLAAAWLSWSTIGQSLWVEMHSRSPNEVIRYLKKRLQGHNKLEAVLLPPLHAAQRRVERTPPPGPLPTLGKGRQEQPLPDKVQGIRTVWPVASPQDIRQALLQAGPGTRIVIAPGLYPFDRKLRLGQDGFANAPIVLSAARPGTVWLEFRHVEGIEVDRPHWVFENLDIRGVCAQHHDCEHAFHVVGRGAHVVLRNNHISDFNAHIKVNGSNGDWPDHGLLAHNTLTNASVRETARPVVPLDLVGANHWRVQDNLVSHFVKRDGNRVSYGLFMKGASRGGRIERNLVICSPSDISRPGIRVGISFGGGGTYAPACRDQRCQDYEHRYGLAANNIVAHCNDVGLDVNHSSQIVLAHNTLINTSGIASRRHPAQASLYGNLHEGPVLARDGTQLILQMNQRMRAQHIFSNPDALQFVWLRPPEKIPSSNSVRNDFFYQWRADGTRPGAIDLR